MRIVRLAALLAVLVVAVASCGGDDSSSDSNGSAQSGPAEVVDRSTLRSGGDATIAAAQGVAQLDPYKFLFTFESVVHRLMYSTLTDYTIDGGDEVKPGLAESWTASDDFRTFTFKLRSGLKLSNGKPLTSKAVAASLERAFDPKTAFVWAFPLAKPKTIETPDAATVRLTLESPERNLPAALTTIPIEDVATLDQINRDPVVTGPYKVSSFTPDQDLVLVRNEHYYGEPAKLDKITVTKAQDNAAAFASLRAEEIQVLWSIPWTDVRQLGTDSRNAIEVTTGDRPVQFVFLETDYKSGVFKNVKARQALAHAVNREAVLKAVYADRGLVAKGNNPVPSWSDLALDDLPAYEFDLDKAKQLFKEAGVGPDTGLTFIAPTGQYTEWTSIGEVLQDDLKKIGIPLKIETMEINQFAARFAPAGKTWPDVIAPNIWGGLPLPLIPEWFAPGVCECNFDNAEYNKARADAKAAPDDAAFQAAFDRAQEILNEQAPATIVLHTDVPVGHLTTIKNIWIDPTGNARLADAGYAK